ncbi:Fur-regulated basic protein FbpA [Metabacillus herbersteinensis]|uniref:Fur-regulated basic protein FbpA n=1 Tax=Metabacillus herbersteinensis TaxID=283816 RepID=A0ABV6GKF6_9BACI
MSEQLRKIVGGRKKTLIKQLLDHGIYKKSERQLYELALSELEVEVKDLRRLRHIK